MIIRKRMTMLTTRLACPFPLGNLPQLYLSFINPTPSKCIPITPTKVTFTNDGEIKASSGSQIGKGIELRIMLAPIISN